MSFEARKDDRSRSASELEFIYNHARIQQDLKESEFKPKGFLLYLNPEKEVAEKPVLDELTGKMTAALNASEPNGIFWRGCHECTCGACSSNTDYILPSGYQTNSLAAHYLALHREEVPEDQIKIIGAFEIEPVDPIDEILYSRQPNI